MVDNPTKIYNDYVRANLPNSMSYDTGTDRYDINSHSFFKFKNSNWYFNYISKYGYSALSAYAVNNFEPALVFDFKGNYFRKSATASTFPASITHAATTNATMTDGYGPEVVTNGKFGTDTAGWASGASAATSAAVSGEMQVTNVSSNGRVVTAIPTVVGRQYEVSGVGRVISGTGGPAASLYLTNNFGTTIQGGNINYTTTDAPLGLSFTATATTSYISAITFGSVGNVSAFDNVSVRQSPVLKWRPHNNITKSNTFSTWTKVSVVVVDNAAVGPNGIANTASTANFSAGSSLFYNLSTVAVVAGDKVTLAAWVRSDTITSLTFAINGHTSVANNTSEANLAVTSTWTLVSFEATVVADDTGLYFVFGKANASSPASQIGELELYGAHMFRSDLGGMVNNPDTTSSYVPTTSAAVYAPRRGHHIYNGSAWVNEGILHESEARTNLYLKSNQFVSPWQLIGSTVTASAGTSPSGLADAWRWVGNGTSILYQNTAYAAGDYTISAWVKSNGAGENTFRLYGRNQLNSGDFTATSEWVRYSFTFNSPSAVNQFSGIIYGASQGNVDLLVYGFQIEAGSTASSYIPTTTSAFVTRAAETLTVPAANLPYPTPVETTGTELVPNGTFDTDLSGWEGYNDTPLWDNGRLYITAPTAFDGARTTLNSVPTTTGKRYKLTWDVELGTLSSVKVDVYGVLSAAGLQGSLTVSATGSYTLYFTAGYSAANIYLLSGNAVGSAWFDNVSVKEINPLALSIQMDGKMTYADTGGDNGKLIRWEKDVSNKLWVSLDSSGASTGSLYWTQRSLGVSDFTSSLPQFFPDTNVPFNLSSRHGSTFLNGAVGGTAGIADTTPVSLPDLSASNLFLGHNLMGTIGEFRMWSDDLGDVGITEATLPSTEPSLSLTFDGSETSFIVLDWSE